MVDLGHQAWDEQALRRESTVDGRLESLLQYGGVQPATLRASPATVTVRLVEDATDWANLMMQVQVPHLPQSWAYGEGKASQGWQPKRAAFCRNGIPVAIATVLERRILGLRVIARVNRGPMFISADPSDTDIISVYSALRRRWRGVLTLAPALEDNPRSEHLLKSAGFRKRMGWGWKTGRISLGASEAELWSNLSSTFRNRARRAEKLGAEVHIATDAAAFEWMIERHLQNMEQKGFRAADATLLRTLRSVNPANVSVFQLLKDGMPVAGMSVVQFGAVAEYHVGWFGPEGRDLNAGNALMWAILREMKARGVESFDVGGLREGDGYTRFKRTMKPEEFELTGEWLSF